MSMTSIPGLSLPASLTEHDPSDWTQNFNVPRTNIQESKKSPAASWAPPSWAPPIMAAPISTPLSFKTNLTSEEIHMILRQMST